MMMPITVPICDIIPHDGAMSLLDRGLEADEDSLTAEVTIHGNSMFCRDGSVPGWVGIEYMAQAIAAWSGWQSHLRGEPPRLGFLLGSRRYNNSRSGFAVGETLSIHVRRQYQSDNGLGQFDCCIHISGAEVAKAAITVYEPQNEELFLSEGQ